MTIRNLLPQEPLPFNELLDLFEGYLSIIGAPLLDARCLISDEPGYNGGPVFSNIIGVVDDASDMVKRLGQIPAARNTGTDVELTLTGPECRRLDAAIPDVIDLLDDMAQTLDQPGDGAAAAPDMAATLRLPGRAARGARQFEAPALYRPWR